MSENLPKSELSIESEYDRNKVPIEYETLKPEHLWEYNTYNYFFGVELNHRAKKPYFDSWDEFLAEGGQALNCNCMFNKPLIWWSWLCPENIQDCNWEEEILHDIVTLIYPTFTSNDLSAIKIKVTKDDESKIKEFIRIRQQKYVI